MDELFWYLTGGFALEVQKFHRVVRDAAEGEAKSPLEAFYAGA